MTPMLRHYLTVKAEHPDAILLYRMGDFFEMFFEDAVTAAPVLDVALTARQKGTASEAPMCGVPHHAVDAYIGRLLDAGYKVAVCDQVEDPAQARGLVRREVTRIVTPGTISDLEMLDQARPNYLAGIRFDGAAGAGAFLDLSTGEFFVRRWSDAEYAVEDLERLAPREVLTCAADFKAGGATPTDICGLDRPCRYPAHRGRRGAGAAAGVGRARPAAAIRGPEPARVRPGGGGSRGDRGGPGPGLRPPRGPVRYRPHRRAGGPARRSVRGPGRDDPAQPGGLPPSPAPGGPDPHRCPRPDAHRAGGAHAATLAEPAAARPGGARRPPRRGGGVALAHRPAGGAPVAVEADCRPGAADLARGAGADHAAGGGGPAGYPARGAVRAGGSCRASGATPGTSRGGGSAGRTPVEAGLGARGDARILDRGRRDSPSGVDAELDRLRSLAQDGKSHIAALESSAA